MARLFLLLTSSPKFVEKVESSVSIVTYPIRLMRIVLEPRGVKNKKRQAPDLNTTNTPKKTIMSVPAALFLVAATITPLFIFYKPPAAIIRHLQRRYPDVLWHVSLPPTRRVVALTLDDGPSAYTQEIADILRANSTHATFFLIGDRIVGAERAAVLRQLVRDGHELANHAMHDEPSCRLPEAELGHQMWQVQERIQGALENGEGSDGDGDGMNGSRGGSAIGSGIESGSEEQEPALHDLCPTPVPTPFFRPGSGWFTGRMRALVARLGFRLVLGSVYPHDALLPWPRVNARHVLGRVRPGSIMVLHDGRAWTAPMLRIVLPELVRRGFRVVSVGELVNEL